MARLSTKVTIDGFEYSVTQLGAVEGRKIWLKILQPLSSVMTALSTKSSLDSEAAMVAVNALMEHLDDSTMEMLYSAFGKNSRVNINGGEPLVADVFDDHFAGRYLSMTKWVGECLVYNFAGFLAGNSGTTLGALVTEIMTKASKRVSPKDSTGTSGAS